jgi:transcriptional regulator GlxA family with amidase domain
MPPRRVVIVGFPRVQSLDVCGPLEVFAGATRWAREGSRAATLEFWSIPTRSSCATACATSSTGSPRTPGDDLRIEALAARASMSPRGA